jgi:hypothetical protein
VSCSMDTKNDKLRLNNSAERDQELAYSVGSILKVCRSRIRLGGAAWWLYSFGF